MEDPALLGGHFTSLRRHHRRLTSFIKSRGKDNSVIVDGSVLHPADLVAVANYNTPIQLCKDSAIAKKIDESVDLLQKPLDEGIVIPGINTGYSHSADTRTRNSEDLSRNPNQGHNSAVLLTQDVMHCPDQLSFKPHALPRNVVRAAMLARCNSLIRGHSALRLSVIEAVATLLNRDFIPIVPLRGTISASGELTPLSYIVASLEGNPDVYVDCAEEDGTRRILSADKALKEVGLKPMKVQPKEGLGLMNGTAVSCVAGLLALHEIQYLAAAAQTLTGMAAEALGSSVGNFDPVTLQTRPRVGQAEVAQSIGIQLRGSKLVAQKDHLVVELYQDRYTLRAAAQLIGVQVEDIITTAKQLEVELNSTTGNPLINADTGGIFRKDNCQAVSVTSAMEKMTTAVHTLGRIMFAQCSELVDSTLCLDDSTVSFNSQGIAINMAAYMTELAFLAKPVSSHVRGAEMHNQAANSLALISARYTMEAVELVSLMTATQLYTVCHSLDLHVMHIETMKEIENSVRDMFLRLVRIVLPRPAAASAWTCVSEAIRAGLNNNEAKSIYRRSRNATEATVGPLIQALEHCRTPDDCQNAMRVVSTWKSMCLTAIIKAIQRVRQRFSSPDEGPTTLRYLGHASTVMYKYVREELGVPLHKSLIDHPTQPRSEHENAQTVEEERRMIDFYINVIYDALRDGRLYKALMESME